MCLQWSALIATHGTQVAVVVDPADYEQLLSSLQSGAGPDAQMRARLAWKAFQHTATYDATVAEWLWSQIGAQPCSNAKFPLFKCVSITCLCSSASGGPMPSSCAHA